MSASPQSFYLSRARRGRGGVALIIVLSAIVFISILIALFLATTTLNRQMSFSSAGQGRAENIAFLGMETTIGDLRSEIVAGSTNSANTPPIYLPRENITMVPYHVGDGGLTNLLKRSLAGSNFWHGSAYDTSITSPIRASASSTLTPAQNGRYVKLERWNAPYLLGETVPPTFQAPDWILVTRQGAVTNANALPPLTALSDSAAGNSQFVLGRYAYTIYDEGGLIDINVAGHPTGVSTNFVSRRGLLPQVDLANLPGIANADVLMNWRNQSSMANYEERVRSNTNGLTRLADGDQSLVSRQDLINYAKAHPDQIELSALQYLATFNRVINAPSFTPAEDRKKTGAIDDSYNPSLIDTRVTETFTRDSDNTDAQIGEPLLKYRFPLERLSLFYSTATTAPAQIQKFFGLTRVDNKSPWVYRGGATSILTLKEVAESGREPDFFELLQAGIAYGSLGTTLINNASTPTAFDASKPAQLAQIAANLIDQYDTDSTPTRIQLGGYSYTISGIENLPYMSRVYSTILRYSGTSRLGFWYQPEVWNPHAQINLPTNAPDRFRFKALGKSDAEYYIGAGGWSLHKFSDKSELKDLNNSSGIMFNRGSNTFTQPIVLSPSMGATAQGADMFSNGPAFVGIHVGDTDIEPATDLENSANQSYNGAPATPIDFELQYWDPVVDDYVTYDRIRQYTTGTGSFLIGDYSTPLSRSFIIRSDPRTDRFGMKQGYDVPTQGQTMRPDAGPGESWWSPLYIGLFSENLPTSASKYSDPDGEVRPADGAYAMASGTAGYPMMANNLQSRPVILNRPFTSVAEMAYASRGMPWKHLDFFHALSADTALLDLFCIKEPAKSTDSTPYPEAGFVNLNTRQPAVLATVISGALKAEDLGSTLATAEADTFAQSLVSLSSNVDGPLANKSELVSRWMPTLSASNADTIIKRRKESVIRALGDIGDTRTWNLLIDIIAQSGRLPTGATSIDKFVVEGERRYWLHVAIDRFTGKVIAQELEQVTE